MKKQFSDPVTFRQKRSFHAQITQHVYSALDSLTDNALMLPVKAGQLQQTGLLFERYHRPLHGFFYHFTGQAAASEDLV